MPRPADLFGVSAKEIAKLTPAQQRELRDLLSQAKKIGERNPLEVWMPHPKQVDFLASTNRTKAIYAGNRLGKSEVGCVHDLIQALPPELVPDHLKPFKHYGWDEPIKGRVITPDLGRTMDVILDKFRRMTPRAGLRGGAWDGQRAGFEKRDRRLQFANGSVIDFMSFEQAPDKFGGVDLHFAHFDEEPNGPNSYKIWRDTRARLIDHGGREIFTMTPLHGEVWVKQMLWDRRGEKGVTIVQAKMSDNPYLDPNEIAEFAKGLTEEERRVVIDGEPPAFAELFYDEFDPAQHVTAPISPAELQRFDSFVMGIDPSLTRTGVVWVAFDSDNSAFVYDELVPPRKTLPQQIVAEIRARNARWGVTPDYNVIDPAARVGNAINAESIEDVYAREGLDTMHGQNQRGPGIFEVKRRLQHEGIRISSDCQTLIWEMKQYRRDPKSSDEYAAVKENDDLCDALRYVLMSRPWAIHTAPAPAEEWSPTSGTAPPPSFFDHAAPGSDSPLGALT